MIKEFFGIVLGFDKDIESLERRIRQMKELSDKYAEDIGFWHDKAEKAEAGYNALKKEFEDFAKPVEIPSAEITFKRPILIRPKEYVQVEIDVRNFIMPDFEMEKALKKKNLVYDGSQDLDKLIPQIYHFAKTGYKYGADKEYGFNEYWMFPFELKTVLKENKAGDCEDWANLIGSHFAAANIPRNRWLISVGTARAGYGHATVYAKDDVGTWRHLNSTKPEYDSKELFAFPSNKDSEDKPGIKPDGFWFSYNDVFAVHQWDSEEAKQAFKAVEDKISIKVEK